MFFYFCQIFLLPKSLWNRGTFFCFFLKKPPFVEFIPLERERRAVRSNLCFYDLYYLCFATHHRLLYLWWIDVFLWNDLCLSAVHSKIIRRYHRAVSAADAAGMYDELLLGSCFVHGRDSLVVRCLDLSACGCGLCGYGFGTLAST